MVKVREKGPRADRERLDEREYIKSRSQIVSQRMKEIVQEIHRIHLEGIDKNKNKGAHLPVHRISIAAP